MGQDNKILSDKCIYCIYVLNELEKVRIYLSNRILVFDVSQKKKSQQIE